MVTIRPGQPEDIPTVHAVNQSAFGQPTEAGIIDLIRTACADSVSLVAGDDAGVVGHILFSPVVASAGNEAGQGMGLGPMAVLPERQRQGIGSLLVRAGIDALRERGCPFIIVLGHPEYYGRFGFVPASRHGLSCQWEGVPDEAFMVLILDEKAVADMSGTVRYREEFDQAL